VRRVSVQTLGASGVEVAVGDQGPPKRQAQLAAVGVTGQHRLVAVSRELVQHPEVRRVRHAHPNVGRGVRRARDGGEVVVRQVRVVDPGERNGRALHGQRAPPVAEVEPAAFGQPGPKLVGG
jgi:hypothetical protein